MLFIWIIVALVASELRFGFIRHSIAIMAKWKQFRYRTGEWPLLSIVIAMAQFLAFALAVALLVWDSAEKHWSNSRLVLYAVIPLGFFVFGFVWLRNRMWIADARRARSRRRIAHSR